jgi:hypothetical protein
MYQPRMTDDDECGAVGAIRGRGNRSNRINLPQGSLSTKHPTSPDLGSNLGTLGGKPATNYLSYCTTIITVDLLFEYYIACSWFVGKTTFHFRTEELLFLKPYPLTCIVPILTYILNHAILYFTRSHLRSSLKRNINQNVCTYITLFFYKNHPFVRGK